MGRKLLKYCYILLLGEIIDSLCLKNTEPGEKGGIGQKKKENKKQGTKVQRLWDIVPGRLSQRTETLY